MPPRFRSQDHQPVENTWPRSSWYAIKEALKGERKTNKDIDGNLVTSRAPGTTLEFSLKLIEILYSREHAEKVAAPMLVAGSF